MSLPVLCLISAFVVSPLAAAIGAIRRAHAVSTPASRVEGVKGAGVARPSSYSCHGVEFVPHAQRPPGVLFLRGISNGERCMRLSSRSTASTSQASCQRMQAASTRRCISATSCRGALGQYLEARVRPRGFDGKFQPPPGEDGAVFPNTHDLSRLRRVRSARTVREALLVRRSMPACWPPAGKIVTWR